MTSLAGDKFNTIKVVPMAAFDKRVQDRGASNVKVIPSVIPLTVKPISGRVKARFCACEMRKFGASADTKSPAAQLCSVRWHGCLTLIFKMKSKQLDATKAYCHGKRDPSSPSISLRLPSMWTAVGYPTKDSEGRSLKSSEIYMVPSKQDASSGSSCESSSSISGSSNPTWNLVSSISSGTCRLRALALESRIPASSKPS